MAVGHGAHEHAVGSLCAPSSGLSESADHQELVYCAVQSDGDGASASYEHCDDVAIWRMGLVRNKVGRFVTRVSCVF